MTHTQIERAEQLMKQLTATISILHACISMLRGTDDVACIITLLHAQNHIITSTNHDIAAIR